MVVTSINKRNCPDPGSYKEAKNLAQETVEKLYDLEKFGVVIQDDIKYKAFEHRASYYATEGQWKKDYDTLLKLESLMSKKIYPSDRHELLRVLQFITSLLDNEGKAEEARN